MLAVFNIPFPGIVTIASRNDNGKIEMRGMKECRYDAITAIEASEHLIFDFSSNSSCAKIWIAKATQNEIKSELGYEFYGNVRKIESEITLLYGYISGACAHSDKDNLFDELFTKTVNAILNILDEFPDVIHRRVSVLNANSEE